MVLRCRGALRPAQPGGSRFILKGALKLVPIAVCLLAAALFVHDGALATLLGAAALLAAGVAWFESGSDSTRELVLAATLGAAEPKPSPGPVLPRSRPTPKGRPLRSS